MAEKCIFCDRREIDAGLLSETDNFFVRATIKGAMAPGHVMVISKKHLSCYGAMPETLDSEYDEVVRITRERVRGAFSYPILAEDGNHRPSVPHAHLHFVPSVSQWYDFSNVKVIEYVPEEIRVEEIRSIRDLRGVFGEEGQYFLIGQDEKLYVCRTRGYNGKLMNLRAIAAQITGKSELIDWRTVTPQVAAENEKWVRETIDKLREI